MLGLTSYFEEILSKEGFPMVNSCKEESSTGCTVAQNMSEP